MTDRQAKVSRAQFLRAGLLAVGSLALPGIYGKASARGLSIGTALPNSVTRLTPVAPADKGVGIASENKNKYLLPLSSEEIEYWKQKTADLDADPEVKNLRRSAGKVRAIATKQIIVQPGCLPKDGGLPPGHFALTFDDGPTKANTELILRALAQAGGVRATFFHIGARSEKIPQLSRLVARRGHALGSHAMHHAYLNLLKQRDAEREIIRGHEAVTNAAGRCAPFFRFPYGEQTPELSDFILRRGLTSFNWNMAAYDWKFEEERYREDLRKLLRGIIAEIDRAGHGVILMHEKTCTALVLPDVLNYLKLKGHTLVQFTPGSAISPTL